MTGRLACFAVPLLLLAGEFPRSLEAFRGKAPTLDGIISAGEWADAATFSGVSDWIPQFTPTRDPDDLSLKGWVKHDGRRLYFAFDVTDDVLYGIDTPRWLPDNNPKAHELTPEGFPWFGDEMELLINPSNEWKGNENAAGNGFSWQMVCNLTKSRTGGVGTGGLIEGEPRRDPRAWSTYQRWIAGKAQECAAKPKPGGKGYILEWAVSFDPCLEVAPGKFYAPEMGDRAVGLNIAWAISTRKSAAKGTSETFITKTGSPGRRMCAHSSGTGEHYGSGTHHLRTDRQDDRPLPAPAGADGGRDRGRLRAGGSLPGCECQRAAVRH
jgi:SSS family solute:Na+ symporter